MNAQKQLLRAVSIDLEDCQRENAKLREELDAARRALDPQDELTSLTVAEIAALRSIKP